MVLKKNFRLLRKPEPLDQEEESRQDFTVVLESRLLKEALFFQSTSILSLYPNEVELYCKDYVEVAEAYGCLGVLCMNQEDAVLKYLALVTGCFNVAKLGDVEIYRLTQVSFIGLTRDSRLIHVADVSKLLSSGHFYFSVPGDTEFFSLTCSAQQHITDPVSDFTWNRSLLRCLTDFGVCVDSWCFKIICGSVEIKTVYVGANQVKSVLLSRVSCERAGTRFNVRGVDDEGHVANFVETEQLVYHDNAYTSFVQVRGTLPVFWNQSSAGGRGNVTLSRGFECSQRAFEKHCARLIRRYGRQMFINLLGCRGSDQLLTEAYKDHYDKCPLKKDIELVSFDYHSYIASSMKLEKMKPLLYKKTENFLQSHGLFHCLRNEVLCMQSGVLRTNCMDCLDRTNVTQMFHAMEMLHNQLCLLGIEEKAYQRFVDTFRSCWEKNGDNLSWIYAGSGALKKTSKLMDGGRSVQRAIQNKFSDTSKQEAINKLLTSYAYLGELGRQTRTLLSPEDAYTAVAYRKALIERFALYTELKPVRVAVGTWNVNGGKHVRSIAFKQSTLTDWLFEPYKDILQATANPVDVFAVGFEELVDLKASSLVHTSSTNRKEWGAELEKILSQNTSYVLLTAEQMVGICLYIFVRPQLVPFIRDVCVSTVKTGLGNRAGNKGAVAIRFLIHGTSICFVCAHLAAHQSHIQERNSDYQEIIRKISFSYGGTLDTEDYVFWCGDLNYRIDLNIDECKSYISSKSWDVLSANDQLNKEKKAGRIFQGFSEGVLSFAPTYKYDQFSDDYDTSEKGRIPAWTDRVLWKRRRQGEYSLYPSGPLQPLDLDAGPHRSDILMNYGEEFKARQSFWHPGKLMFYGRAELKTSDHRPVIAVFDVNVFKLKGDEYTKVRSEVLQELGPADQTVVVSSDGGGKIDEPKLRRKIMKFGGIILMRPIVGGYVITLHDSRAALEALSLDGQECEGIRLKVTLRTPHQEKKSPVHLSVKDSDLKMSGFPSMPHLPPVIQPSKLPCSVETDLIEDSLDDVQEMVAGVNGDDHFYDDDDYDDDDDDNDDDDDDNDDDDRNGEMDDFENGYGEPYLENNYNQETIGGHDEKDEDGCGSHGDDEQVKDGSGSHRDDEQNEDGCGSHGDGEQDEDGSGSYGNDEQDDGDKENGRGYTQGYDDFSQIHGDCNQGDGVQATCAPLSRRVTTDVPSPSRPPLRPARGPSLDCSTHPSRSQSDNVSTGARHIPRPPPPERMKKIPPPRPTPPSHSLSSGNLLSRNPVPTLQTLQIIKPSRPPPPRQDTLSKPKPSRPPKPAVFRTNQ